MALARGASALKKLAQWVGNLSEEARFKQRLAELDALEDEEARLDAWAGFLTGVLQVESAQRDEALVAIYDVSVETGDQVTELGQAVKALRGGMHALREEMRTVSAGPEVQILPPSFPEGPGPSPEAEPAPPGCASEGRYDFFLSHASEDKARFVEALYVALTERGAKVWYDAEKSSSGTTSERSWRRASPTQTSGC